MRPGGRHEHRRRTSTRRGRHHAAAVHRRIEAGSRRRHARSEMVCTVLRCRRVSGTRHRRGRSHSARRQRRSGRRASGRRRTVRLCLQWRRVHLWRGSRAAVATEGLLLAVRGGIRSAATVGLLWLLLLLRCWIHPAVDAGHRSRNSSGSEDLECRRRRAWCTRSGNERPWPRCATPRHRRGVAGKHRRKPGCGHHGHRCRRLRVRVARIRERITTLGAATPTAREHGGGRSRHAGHRRSGCAGHGGAAGSGHRRQRAPR